MRSAQNFSSGYFLPKKPSRTEVLSTSHAPNLSTSSLLQSRIVQSLQLSSLSGGSCAQNTNSGRFFRTRARCVQKTWFASENVHSACDDDDDDGGGGGDDAGGGGGGKIQIRPVVRFKAGLATFPGISSETQGKPMLFNVFPKSSRSHPNALRDQISR